MKKKREEILEYVLAQQSTISIEKYQRMGIRLRRVSVNILIKFMANNNKGDDWMTGKLA